MAKLIIKTDRENGNFEDVFLHSLNASFNGIEGDISSAEIRLLVPKNVDIFLGDVEDPIKELRTENVENGVLYTFDFGEIKDLGIAVRIGFGLQFNSLASNGDTVTISPEMWINGEQSTVAQGQEITLLLQPRFDLVRELILPKIAPASGGAVYYKATLENFGDLGATVNNIVINCEGLELLKLDENFIVQGKDVSQKARFSDTSQDGVTGIVDTENNTLTFSLSEYKGQRYEFVYRGVIDENALEGTELDTIATWSIDNVQQVDDVHVMTLADEVSDADISLYVPKFTLSEKLIGYEIFMENSGNQVIEDVSFTVDLPQEVDYKNFSTGSFYIGAIDQDLNADYTIDYTTNNGVPGSFGTYNTNSNTVIDLSEFIKDDDNLSSIRWNLEKLGVGTKQKVAPSIKGVTKPNLETGSVMMTSFETEWNLDGTPQRKVNTQSTVVQDICVLLPIFSQSANGKPLRPKDKVRYTIGANAISSRLNHPVFATILPKEMVYAGNESLSVNTYFEESEIPQIPQAVVIENFFDNGDTLVKFAFTGDYAHEFNQKAIVKIEFDAVVSDTATGNIKTQTLLNVADSTGEVAEGINIYKDTNNIAGEDDVSIFYAESLVVENRILLFLSTKSDKKVRGLLDTEFIEQPSVGKTIAGGEVVYQITIENTGNADIDELDIVDILPYIGDTGVIEINSQRKSEFPIYNVNEVVAKITESTGEVIKDVPIEIMYTQSNDPVRFGDSFNIIGSVDDWSETPPSDITTVRGFKAIVKGKIKPKQILILMISAIAPTGTGLNKIAWNSFATEIAYTNLSGEKEYLLGTEPEKVGVQINPVEPDKGTIKGLAWFDKNCNGEIDKSPEEEGDVDEIGLNDVGVVLYDSNGKAIKWTFTANNINEKPGHYSFGNLPVGSYYIRFFVDDDVAFTTQRLDIEKGSKPNPKTGITPRIEVVAGDTTQVNVGLITKQSHHIKALLAVNKSAQSMMRSVIYDQMLISMKHEDVMELLDN